MVGYEPDLNPFVDWDKEFRELLELMRSDDETEDKPNLAERPKTSDNATLMKPLIRPCQTRKAVATCEVVDEGYAARLATPLIQVLSVSISSDFSDGKPCEIYGSIRAFEGSDCRFVLYDRDPEDSEIISKEDTLSLIGPDGGAIIPSLSTRLDLCLKDRIRGVEVVKGNLDFDPVADDSYDRLLNRDVPGDYGVAHVYYVIFRFAVYGTVQVTITKNDNVNKKSNAANIYGSVVAGYENDRSYCSNDQEVGYLKTSLLQKSSCQPLSVMLGIPIKLSRNVVVVPVFSFLTIEVNLWDSTDEIACECLRFPGHLLVHNPLYIRTQYASVEVKVQWSNPYIYLYKYQKMDDRYLVKSFKEGVEVHKKPRILHDQHLSTSVPSLPSTMITSSYYGRSKVDVFSVFVGGITEKISALCGTILVQDGSDMFSIYNRDESCSELLPDDSLACIEVNYRSIQNAEFGIILNLRDPVGKLEVSRGDLGWNVGSLGTQSSWYKYNRHLCSVVRGKDGYAAVHYEVFNNAFEAVVEVKLFGNGHPDIPIILYGTLNARHSGHDYSTSYQKKYYTSRLFDFPRDRSMELKTGSSIEMLKSIFVIPARSSLIIEANLGAFAIDNVDEPIRGMAEFQINLCDSVSKIIPGENYWIEIYAKFQK